MLGSGIQSIAINAFYLSSAKAITSFSRALYAIFLAKILGAELYGLLNYGISWYVLLVPISVLGLNTIIIREIGRDTSQLDCLLGETLALRTISGFVVACLSFIFAWFLESDPITRQLLFIFSVALLGRSFSLWANAVFTGFESSGFVWVQEVFFRLLEVFVGVTLLMMGFGVIEVAMMHAASWLLQGLIGLGLIRRYLIDVQMIWNRLSQMDLIKRGMPFVVSSFLVGWLLQGPILMYRYFEGFGSELGQLALTLQALFILGAIASELGGAALPVLARSVDRGDDKSGYFIDLVLRGGALMSGVLTITALAIGPWLVDFLFGRGYELTAVLLPWSLLLVAPYFWVNTLSSVLVAHGRYRMIMLINSAGVLIFTLSFPFLVALYDLTGAIIALALGLFASVAGYLFTLQMYYSVIFIKVLFSSLSAVFVAVLITYGVLELDPLSALLIGLFSLFWASILFGMFRKQEVKMAIDFFRLMVKK